MERINEPLQGHNTFQYQAALQDFLRARRRASLEKIFAFLRGQSSELLSYEKVRKQLKVTGMSIGKLQEIPLDAIVGSVGRYKDFTRQFLPLINSDQRRWAKVKSIATSEEGLPPIEVYQIGEVYFVLDGNHRVSVARQMGAKYIEAYVTKIQTKIPISPDVGPAELTQKAEYADFLARTHVDELRPDADLTMTMAGKYRLLEEQIEDHRYFMGTEQRREILYNEAVLSWYDTIYLPITAIITRHDILKDFPDHTLTDLYLWVSEYRAAVREEDVQYFEQHMTEILDKLPLVPDIELDKLILDVEYIDFLEYTRIDGIKPNADLRVTAPGKYSVLAKHIEVHRHFMGEQQQREIPFEEAVKHWYETVYSPIIEIIRRLGMLREFPNRTEADLYLWISEHQEELNKQLGWQILPEKAATDLVDHFSHTPERILSRVGGKVLDAITPDELEAGPPPGIWRKQDLMRRNDRLFGSFLVPVSGEKDGWSGLEQALLLARQRGQHVYGLHVIPPDDEIKRETALAVQAEFTKRCQEAGVEGVLTIQEGETARKISELSRWADLVILHLAHPPGTQALAKIQSGFRTILWQCSRPVLAVPGAPQEIRRILLAYDGSQKADEALFIGAYMGSYWKISLNVITVEEIGRTSPRVQRLAKDYLKRRNVEANFITAAGNVSEMILTNAETYKCDLIIMGGYGRGPMLEMVLGSTVDHILQHCQIPILICR